MLERIPNISAAICNKQNVIFRVCYLLIRSMQAYIPVEGAPFEYLLLKNAYSIRVFLFYVLICYFMFSLYEFLCFVNIVFYVLYFDNNSKF